MDGAVLEVGGDAAVLMTIDAHQVIHHSQLPHHLSQSSRLTSIYSSLAHLSHDVLQFYTLQCDILPVSIKPSNFHSFVLLVFFPAKLRKKVVKNNGFWKILICCRLGDAMTILETVTDTKRRGIGVMSRRIFFFFGSCRLSQ